MTSVQPRSAERIWVSSSSLRAKTVASAAERCQALGIPRLELTSSFPFYEGLEEEAVAASRGGVRLLLHNYFPPPRHGFVVNLASRDAGVRERSIAHCHGAMELSALVGAPFFSVHAGFAVDPRPSELGRVIAPVGRKTLAESGKVFFDSVAALCERARALGLLLLIENNVLARRNLVDGRNELLLCVTADDIDELFEHVESPLLGLLLDVAHLKVSARTLGFDRAQAVSQMARYVRSLHVSDNNGESDDNEPFDQNAWFLPHLAAVTEGPCVIETKPLDAPALLACAKVLEDVI